MSEEMVSVPKALLAEVLDTAESNSRTAQAEFAATSEEGAPYYAERELIFQLRKMAGIMRLPTPPTSEKE